MYRILEARDIQRPKRITFETPQESKALERLRNKPFWIWDAEVHKLPQLMMPLGLYPINPKRI
jgi:hypothetical protein